MFSRYNIYNVYCLKKLLDSILISASSHEDILTNICLTINLLITILYVCNQELFLKSMQRYR